MPVLKVGTPEPLSVDHLYDIFILLERTSRENLDWPTQSGLPTKVSGEVAENLGRIAFFTSNEDSNGSRGEVKTIRCGEMRAG